MSVTMPVHHELSAAIADTLERERELRAAERDVAGHAMKKAAVRVAAVLRIMAQPAPSGKPHSWTSAEALRDTDSEYAEWKRLEATYAEARGRAETALWAARLRAEYLARTLPAEPVRSRKDRCIHGIAMWEGCELCEADADAVVAAIQQTKRLLP